MHYCLFIKVHLQNKPYSFVHLCFAWWPKRLVYNSSFISFCQPLFWNIFYFFWFLMKQRIFNAFTFLSHHVFMNNNWIILVSLNSSFNFICYQILIITSSLFCIIIPISRSEIRGVLCSAPLNGATQIVRVWKIRCIFHTNPHFAQQNPRRSIESVY